MTAHQDVAGLVDKADAWDAIAEKNAEIARLRQEMSAAIAFWKAAAKRFSDARKSAVRRIQSDADRLESLSQALREAEAALRNQDGMEYFGQRFDRWHQRAIAAESRLAEAMKVIGGGIAAWEALPEGNYSPKTIERWLKDNLKPHADAARAFIAGNGGKDGYI